MRLISQDGTFDVPYEQVVIQRYSGRIYWLNKNLIGVESGITEDFKIASYSSESKAIKVMEMLREKYNNNEFYHYICNTDTFEKCMALLSDEKYEETTSEYFQFPKDDEVEVQE